LLLEGVVRAVTPAMVFGQGGCSFGHSIIRCRQASEGSVMDIARGELVERELDILIERRSRKGEGS
jgi:hypothetical protein